MRRVAIGLFAVSAATAYGFGFYGITNSLWPDSGMLLLSFLAGAPMAACVLAVWMFDPRGERGGGGHAALSALVVTAMLLGAAAVLKEGAVCIAMAAPLFYAFGIGAGVLAGGLLNRRGRNRHSLVLVLLPLAVVPFERPQAYPVAQKTVATSMIVDAPVDVVWDEMIEIRNIRDDELGFTLTQDVIGVPKPVDARLEGRGVGAVRHATWRGGVTFQERVTDWREHQYVGWRFHVPVETQRALLDDHLRVGSEYLDVVRGAYELTPLPDGRTRLTLSTTYRVRSPMNEYAGLWGRLFLGDFHQNVLKVVQRRAEARAV